MGQLFLLSDRGREPSYMSARWGRPLADSVAATEEQLLVDPSRVEVEARLDGQRIVAFFGHGTPNTLGVPTLIDLQNIHLATGVVVAVACRSAAALGPAAVQAGASAYVGFDDDLPVLRAPEIDSLICEGFARLLAGEESPADFGRSFIATCERLQTRHYTVDRGERHYVVGMEIQILKRALKVLER